MDDSAMIMRIKYKTKPGDQFAIRKEVYRLLQEAFREEGIEFAHKNVTVYMPPEISQSSSTSENASHQKIMQAGAAAVDEEQAPQVAQKNL
jgi:small-conductance mechanosensitive channel